MHLPRLYIDQNLDIGDKVMLPEKSGHHVQQVLRTGPGGRLVLFNGLRGEYTAVISAVIRSQVEVNIIHFEDVDRESRLDITLGLSILKREAMNKAIEKATELGVTNIVPLETTNISVSRKKIESRHDHWNQVIQSACEQCGRTKLPSLAHAISFTDWINSAKGDLKLIPSLQATRSLADVQSTPVSIYLPIGPEGGFSAAEETCAVKAGFIPVRLGRRVLRAETVPAALLSLLQFRWGDF